MTTVTMMKKRFLNINPFSTNVPVLHPLKISENFGFFVVFRVYSSDTLVENRLNLLREILYFWLINRNKKNI